MRVLKKTFISLKTPKRTVLLNDTKLFLLITVAVLLYLISYFDAIKLIVKLWASSEEYNHAFLMVPIIVYIVFRKKSELAISNSSWSTSGIFLLVLSSIAYYFSLLTQVNTLILLSFFTSLLSVIIYFFGVFSIKQLLTPLFLLFLLIPIPDQLYISITFPLQIKVSQISEFFLHFSGIPLLRQGNIMHIPNKSFEVVEACSGMRSVITLLTLSIVMGYFFLSQMIYKMVLIAVSIPIAILVNIVRVTGMIILFYFFNIDLSSGSLHTLTGLIVFALSFIFLFMIQYLLTIKDHKWLKK